jgi:hypothetical protein
MAGPLPAFEVDYRNGPPGLKTVLSRRTRREVARRDQEASVAGVRDA